MISRTDNIGDVILTLPLAGILKTHFPNCKISFLAREYARAIVEHCVHINHFISWDKIESITKDDAISILQTEKVDMVIHAFPNPKIAAFMKKARIRYRVGTSHRLYHWLTCNVRVNFSRKKSTLHEAQLNLFLLTPFHIATHYSLQSLSEKMGLYCNESLAPHLKNILLPNHFHLIIHPFTNGNTREWPVSHFNALIQRFPQDRIQVIVTGSKKESIRIQDQITAHCPQITDVSGQCSLQELMQLIAQCDGLIANSTGPLHLAAALNIHALGLFPATRGMDITRWAPLGKKAEVLSADLHCQSPRCREMGDCICMESITVESVYQVMMKWVASASTQKSSAFKHKIG